MKTDKKPKGWWTAKYKTRSEYLRIWRAKNLEKVRKQGRDYQKRLKENGGKTIKRPKNKMYRTPIYNSWASMKSRCYNKNSDVYHHYGGRGIITCDEWLTFEGFYKDMGPSHKKGLTLERIDVNKGYYPENCKWIPLKDQINNRRNTVYVEYRGKRVRFKELVDRSGVSYDALFRRYHVFGWSVEDTFEKPLKRQKDSSKGRLPKITY